MILAICILGTEVFSVLIGRTQEEPSTPEPEAFGFVPVTSAETEVAPAEYEPLEPVEWEEES